VAVLGVSGGSANGKGDEAVLPLPRDKVGVAGEASSANIIRLLSLCIWGSRENGERRHDARAACMMIFKIAPISMARVSLIA